MQVVTDSSCQVQLRPFPLTAAPPEGLAEAVRSGLRDMLGGAALPGAAEYTHALQGVRIVCPVAASGKSGWEDCMNWLGKELFAFRSYRSRATQDPLCKADHNLVADFLDDKGISRLPNRVEFGLPHNYFYYGSRFQKRISPEKATIAPLAGPDGEGRRGSPLFVHIHRFSDGNHTLVLMSVPSRFLPDGHPVGIVPGSKLESNPDNWTHKNVAPKTVNWSGAPSGVVNKFLDEYDKGGTL